MISNVILFLLCIVVIDDDVDDDIGGDKNRILEAGANKSSSLESGESVRHPIYVD